MIYVSLDSLVGQSVLGYAQLILPAYSTPQSVVIPVVGAEVFVYQRDTAVEVDVFEAEHGGGPAAVQPLTTNSEGKIVDSAGNRVYVAQPQELDIVISGGGLSATRTIPVGAARDPASLTDVHVVGSDAAMLAIAGAHEGTVAVRSDLNNAAFMNNGAATGTDADWTEIGFVDVVSVNGRSGVVVLTAGDVGADATGAAAAVLASSLQKAANLSDVADADASRANVRVPVLREVKAVSTANVAALSGLPVIDGYQTVAGDRVLLVGQTTGTQNGVWVAAAGAWSRPSDYATGAALTSRLVPVVGGTAGSGKNTLWQLDSTAAKTIDTDATAWVRLTGGFATIIESVNAVAASGAAQTIPDVTSDTMNRVVLSANCTLTFPAAAAGKSFLLALVQDATGGRTVVWPGSVKWAGGVAPTLTSTASKADLFSFICLDGANWLGVVAGQNF